MPADAAGDGTAASASHRIVITPPGRLRLPSLPHLWEAREVLIRFGARDITLRYRQTALGIIWVILQPLLSAGVFTLVFGRVARLPTDGVPYFLFSFVGMLAWNVFSNVATRAAPSLVGNAALVSKVFFPRLLVPLSTIYSVLVDFGVSFAMLIVLWLVYGVAPSWALVLVPVWTLSTVLLGAALGIVCSGLMVRYRDVQYVVPFVMQILLYASPIAYALSAVPSRYRWLYDTNPLTWILEEFRWSLLDQGMPPVWQIICSVIVPIVIFGICTIIFEQMERSLADVI